MPSMGLQPNPQILPLYTHGRSGASLLPRINQTLFQDTVQLSTLWHLKMVTSISWVD